MLGGNVKIRARSGGLNENDSGFKGEVLIEEEGNRGSCSSSLCLVSSTSLLGHLGKQDASHLILEPFPLP